MCFKGFCQHAIHSTVSSYIPPPGGSTHIHCPRMDSLQESQ